MPKPQPNHVSIMAPAVWRRFLLSFSCGALVFSVIIAVIYHQDVLHQRGMLEQKAQHVVALQQELLLFEFRGVQSDLLYLANQEKLTRFLSGDQSARSELERDYASFALNKGVYAQVRCLDTMGQESVRVNYRDGDAIVVPQDELQTKTTRYYYQRGLSLEEGEVFVSPFDLNVEHGQIQRPINPVIRFLTPVFDDSGEKRGLLVLNFLGAPLLAKLKQVSAGFSGETMLVNPAGEYLQTADPRHEWGWLLGHRHSFRVDFPVAWEQGKRLDAGQLRARKDLFTFQCVSPGHRPSAEPIRSSTKAIADHDLNSLILVSHVSSSVATAHSRQLLSQLLFMYVGVMAVVALLALYWARSSEIRRYHEQRIVESESRLRKLSSLLLSSQEAERRNLSRDLHDELGQQMTAISLDLQSLEKQEGGTRSNPLLRRAIEETEQLLKSLHEIATRVRPSVLDDLGLRDAVESFLSEYQDRKEMDVRSRLHFHRERIPSKIGENAFRILQEALANVVSHAQVGQVDVDIETDSEMLYMTVKDSGVGFELEEQKDSTRLGILGMRERVELLNGQFDLQSKPGEGTQIHVAIPLCEEGQSK
ncbi:Oxygen sensor histidine kinase NreB [Symmachiella macrocystis]|uniref:Oxygen sensor histidine kinase NreB n=1 Tax=Symmachiella macrocystis TaxID=2527985 RepID=A0A5C6BMK3_9PLAN|nr:ATP-binding protein [Symmachiella macrocystis]TWU13380.1 Oxygen sensor histidine kinase NreB [Symmachiella macrocystis]